MLPTTMKTLHPIMVTSLTIISVVAFTPHISFISIPISFIPQWLRVAGYGLLWSLNHHSQLWDLSSQTHNVIFSLHLSKSHLDSLPGSVLLFGFNLMGCCHQYRVCYPWVIKQIAHGIMLMLVKPMKEKISQVLLDFAHTQHHRVFLLNHIQCPLQMGYRYQHLFCLSSLQFVKLLH